MSVAEIQVAYGREWWPSLTRLDPGALGRVADAMRLFEKDPANRGLNLEMLQGDRRLHSIRASQSIRILLAKEGNTYVFLEAGQHDDVYQRASRMRFVANPTTGFVGLVAFAATEADERTEPERPRIIDYARGVLDHWSDAELREVGFDDRQIELLRGCGDEDGLCLLDMPGDRIEQAIDLLELTPEQWRTPSLDPEAEAEERVRAAITASPESFSPLFSAAEAVAIATAPIEDWMVFLHPDQRQAAIRHHAGPARVRGSAGTGKTVVGIHRAAHLARTLAEDEGPILFTTFIKSLPPVFESLFHRLPGVPDQRVEFINLDRLAHRICAEAGDRPTINPRDVDAAFATAFKQVVTPGSPLAGFTREYLRAEVTSVIKGRGLRSIDEYLGIERTGRRTRFTEPQRRQAWHLREAWDQQMAARRVIDFPDVVLRARDHARRRPQPTYRAAIIDEAQDLTLVGLQLIRALVNGPDGLDRPNALLILGDGAQRIYSGGFTLRQAGVDVRGRTTVLRTNYRNTRQIIGAAMAVAGGQVVDDLGDESRRGDADANAVREGIPPVLKTCSSATEELEFITRQIAELVATGAISPGDIAVAAATNHEVDDVATALRAAGHATQDLRDYQGVPTPAVKVGTHHRIKGLEFKVVFLPFLGIGQFPRARQPGQDDNEYQEQRDLAVSQLFVAMTRARDGLFLTCTGDPSSVLEPGLEVLELL